MKKKEKYELLASTRTQWGGSYYSLFERYFVPSLSPAILSRTSCSFTSFVVAAADVLDSIAGDRDAPLQAPSERIPHAMKNRSTSIKIAPESPRPPKTRFSSIFDRFWTDF